MNKFFKIIFRKFVLSLIVFIIFSIIFIFVNNYLFNRLKTALEERSNLLKVINEQIQTSFMVNTLKSETKKLEDKYKIDLNKLYADLKEALTMPDAEVKNKIITLSKDKNLSLKEEPQEETPRIFKFSLSGNFDDLKQFENILRENKIKVKINSIRIFPEPNGKYLFKIEILLL